MLTDAEVERYARQIVLPEVGGRGQERLLASRVRVLGDGPASRHAALLLRRAGVQVTDADGEVSAVVDLCLAPTAASTRDGTATANAGAPLVRGRLRDTCATVDALPAGRRAADQQANDVPRGGFAGPLFACTLHVLGALAASEALALLLVPARGARRTTIDLTAGVFTAAPLEASA